MNFDFLAAPLQVGPLEDSLDAIQTAQLIRHAEETEPTFQFKHGLVPDTAYGSLMRTDRRRLHYLVGEALEEQAAGRLDELAPLLGHHFSEAGDVTRAGNYLRRAGDAARRAMPTARRWRFSRKRWKRGTKRKRRHGLAIAPGEVYERIGEFDQRRRTWKPR